MKQKKIESLLLFILLALMASFPSFSTDSYLSSMPVLSDVLHASRQEVQLTLGLYFTSFALMQLIWGPISDRVGRKMVLLAGLIIFILASGWCALTGTIVGLIEARALQGMGACAASVLVFAMVSDTYEGNKAVKMLAFVSALMAIAPIVAPLIGSYLLLHWGWRSVFLFLMLLGVLTLVISFGVKETLKERDENTHYLKEFIKIFTKPVFFWPALCTTACFTALFAYISDSSFIFQQIYGLNALEFGYFFAANSAGLILGNLLLSQIVEKFTKLQLALGGIALLLLGALGVCVLTFVFPNNVWVFMGSMFVVTFGVALALSPSVGLALGAVHHQAGMGSALIGGMRYGMGAVIASVMAAIHSNSPAPLGVVMLIAGGVGLLSLVMWKRAHEKIKKAEHV